MSSGSDSFFDWRKIALNLTTACNLRCKMCPVVVRPTESLTRDEAFGVADFAARRGFDQIVVTGGEPTIMPYFWDLMDRLAATPMLVQVLTNAYRLNPDHIARMARMPRLIANVSLDGVGPVHDAIRGEGAFAATDANIRGLIAAGVRVAVNTTVQAGNYRNMLDLYEHLKY